MIGKLKCFVGLHQYKPFVRVGLVNCFPIKLKGKRCKRCKKEIDVKTI